MTAPTNRDVASGLATEARARYEAVAALLQERHDPPADVVELGAAPGDQIAELARRGYRTTAVDIGVASDAWAHAEEGRMISLLASTDTDFIPWNLEATPYPLPDSSWDAVLMTEVYEHLRDYPIRSLEECYRILRPGGRLYFTTPNIAYVINRIRALRGYSTASSLADWIGGLPHARHAREYTFAEAHELLELSGFEIELSISRHFHIEGGRSGKLNRFIKQGLDELAQRRKTLGPMIVIVARKPHDR